MHEVKKQSEYLPEVIRAIDAVTVSRYEPKRPGTWIIERMTRYRELGLKTMPGQVFEHYIGMAIEKHGIKKSRILRNVDVVKGKSTEMDFLIKPCFGTRWHAIHAKTSVRERWAQPDRAAILSEIHRGDLMGLIDHYLVMYREKPEDSFEKVSKFCAKKSKEWYSIKGMITVMDDQSLSSLLDLIKGDD